MYKETSQRYKNTIYNPSIQSVVNIYIDNVLLNPKYLTDFKSGCEDLFGDNLELGSVTSQYIEMQIHKDSGIINPKKIRIEYGILVNNALTVTEVNKMLIRDFNKLQVKSLAKENKNFETIPIGIYNVDDYDNEDDNVINIKALDNIIKLDADDGYYDASELIKEKGYATLGEIAEDICNKKGLELETSSFLNSNNQVSVYDNQLKAREYMSYIAEKAGGICCANREGKIQFRRIGQDTTEIPLKLFKTYQFGEEYKISKVAFEDGVRSFKFGNETRNTLWIRQENLFVTAEKEIQDIYNEIKDLTINSFEGTVIIDPAIDIGDKIKIGDKYIIYQGEMTLNKRFIADIKSKIAIKQKQETTAKKEKQTVINRRVQSEINQIDGKITQLVEENTETSNKLSKHEQTIDSIKDTVSSQETKIETVENKANANTTKITTNTTKIAEVEKTVDGITQSVSAVEEKVETVEDNINTNYYTKTETNSKINQKADSITSSVSKTYSTKTETATAKTEAINSANTTTDNKLKNYSTTTQMNSKIEQTAESINSEVSKKVGKNEIISKINQSAETVGINANKIELSANDILNLLAGNTINLTSKNIVISSDKFSVDKNGKVTCSDINVTGGKILLKDGSQDNANLTIVNNNDNNIKTEVCPGTIYVETDDGGVYINNEINTNSKAYMYSNSSGGGITLGGKASNDIILRAGANTKIICYGEIQANSHTNLSLKSKKRNIKKLRINAIDLIKKSDIYTYNYKKEKEGNKRHIGLVIGNGYNCPNEVISEDGEGIEQYSMTSLAWKAIQEQQEQIEQLQEKDKQKDKKIQDLIKRIEPLEKGVSK